jgi:hypothetical protein
MIRTAACLLLLLAACVKIDDTYAPPIQRRPVSGPDTSRLKHFIAMNDPAAEDHFLRDVGPLEGESWRWTRQNPTLRFVLPSTRGLKLLVEFGIHDDTLRSTGPLTITYLVNGHVLDRVRYEKSGGQSFQKAVPSEWLGDGEDVVVKVALDKVYVAPADGAQLGVTLARAGFVE